jgi:hypothetical protein
VDRVVLVLVLVLVLVERAGQCVGVVAELAVGWMRRSSLG